MMISSPGTASTIVEAVLTRYVRVQTKCLVNIISHVFCENREGAISGVLKTAVKPTLMSKLQSKRLISTMKALLRLSRRGGGSMGTQAFSGRAPIRKPYGQEGTNNQQRIPSVCKRVTTPSAGPNTQLQQQQKQQSG